MSDGQSKPQPCNFKNTYESGNDRFIGSFSF